MKNILRRLFVDPVDSREKLVAILTDAANQQIFDKDSLPLLEAVIQFGDMRAKDILLPRNKVDVIDINSSLNDVVALINQTGHSRFPVVEHDNNDVVGILHSKDIVKFVNQTEEFELLSLLRKPVFVPDMKALDSLLYEMRLNHNHLVIVVDEFTNIAGIITLEMIVEQIVGEIDDEHDSIDGEHGILKLAHNIYRAKGYCGLEQFNNLTNKLWHDEQVESLGGYIVKYLGRVPQGGEKHIINDCVCEIISADSRKINTLKIIINDQ